MSNSHSLIKSSFFSNIPLSLKNCPHGPFCTQLLLWAAVYIRELCISVGFVYRVVYGFLVCGSIFTSVSRGQEGRVVTLSPPTS